MLDTSELFSAANRDKLISFSFRQFLVRLASRSLSVLRGVSKFIGLGFKYGLGRPLCFLGRVFFRLVILPSYRPYARAKRYFRRFANALGLHSFGHFLQRYSLYAVLVVIGVLATGNNIFARTIRPDEIGQGAIWTSFAQSDIPDLVVDTTPANPISAEPALALGGQPLTTKVASAKVDEEVTAIGQETPGDTSEGTASTARTETVQYKVVGGDTISGIAERYGLGTKTILWANGLSESDYIKPGQVLKIPAQNGVLYTVKRGDTLASIAKKYGGQVSEILEANQLASAEAIQTNMEIIIPGGEPPATVKPKTSIVRNIFGGSSSTVIPKNATPGRGLFTWPTTSKRINQYYRGRYHTGIDVDGNYSSPIYAAASGTVSYASRDYSGYGLHIIINHGNGYTTLYGHASKIFVHAGQHVSAGQTIGMIGSTGRSTGPHLHFEIRPCADYSCSPFLNPLSFF